MSEPNHEQKEAAGVSPDAAAAAKIAKSSRGAWVFVLAAVVIMLITVLTRGEKSIAWVRDYHKGLELARQQNKPVLLAFESDESPLCAETRQNTYSNPDVIRYVTDHFIPILINAQKDKLLVEQYAKYIPQYPTHIVKRPDDERLATFFGYNPPPLFLKKITEALERINRPAKNTSSS